MRRALCLDGDVPAADEHRGDRADIGIESGVDAPLDAARNASAAARYCSRENRSVTLIGMPAKIASSMAGRPSLVPGILMNRLGRPARAYSSLAAREVLAVS